MSELLKNKHGVELPKILKPGDKIVYYIDWNEGKRRTAVIEIVSVYSVEKQKYNVRVVECEDESGNKVESFGNFKIGQTFRCILDYEYITYYESYWKKVAKTSQLEEEWENC